MDEILRYTPGWPAKSDMDTCEDGTFYGSILVRHLAILEEFKESKCVGTQPCHYEDSLLRYEVIPILELVTHITRAFCGDSYAYRG